MAKRTMHLPTVREERTAEIADCLADLAGVYCGAEAEGDHDLRQRLANLSDRDLARLERHLQAAVNAIV